MPALGRRRAACGPSFLLSVAAGTRPAARRLWLVPINENMNFVTTFCVHSLPPRRYFVPAGVGPVDLGSAAADARFGGSPGNRIGEDRRRAQGRTAGTGRARGRTAGAGDGRSSRAARRWWRSWGRPGRRRDKIRQPGGVGFLRRLEPGGGAKKRVRSGGLGKFLPEPPQISAKLTSVPGGATTRY